MDRKKLRVEFLAQGGSSSSKGKTSKLGGWKSPTFNMRKGVLIGLREDELKAIEEAEPTTLIHALLEFQSHSLVLSRRVAKFLKKWLKRKHQAD